MLYRSGRMPKCYTCQAYANMVTNARQKTGKRASNGTERAVTFSLEEFHQWAAYNPRMCFFCGISDEQYWDLNLRSSNGARLEALGLDRLDNSDDYHLDNLAWCCYPCNRAKGNAFSTEEMRQIGHAIRGVWAARATQSSA